METLKDPKVKNIFVFHLKNRFQLLSDAPNYCEHDADYINQRWDIITSVYQENSKISLGMKEGAKKKEWMTQESLECH